MCLSAVPAGGVKPVFGSVGISRMVAASWLGKLLAAGGAAGGVNGSPGVGGTFVPSRPRSPPG
jgi:hypothetical protein